MPTTDNILSWRGRELRDSEGDKVGKIEEIYLDADTNEPEWALVNTGLFGTKSTFVPLRNAAAEDDEVRVPYDKAKIKDAPTIEADAQLSQREESQLYQHYGLDYSKAESRSGLPEGSGAEAPSPTTGSSQTAATGGAADPASGAGTGESGRRGDAERGSDDAMTRSEEELQVGTTKRESGRVRLRKHVETEDVSETVPVKREEARVKREPITDANVDEATSGPDIAEGEHEVVLHEEEVVAEKRTVPKERVRLDKEKVTDEREVSDTVRSERIEVDEGDTRER
jgi:uncharacterized protein (TIGR02271 family)